MLTLSASSPAVTGSTLSRSDFETAPAHLPPAEGSALDLLRDKAPVTLSMAADVGPARTGDAVQPDPAAPRDGGGVPGRYREFLNKICIGMAPASMGVGLLASFASPPLGCQICGYGLLAGSGLGLVLDFDEECRAPGVQRMLAGEPSGVTTAGLLTEASLGLTGLGLATAAAGGPVTWPLYVGGWGAGAFGCATFVAKCCGD
ncbi:hypothetical protein ACT80S_10505 [Ramlibacter sp. MAHUQ-53]|uniref:hypothetical protein n=1 Tax=unclassified Ramlibacter TaxID=2617605 RepID=UPI003632BF3B